MKRRVMENIDGQEVIKMIDVNNSKWKIETTKDATEIFIVNNKYRFFVGDVWNGINYDSKRKRTLLKDAEIFCNKLNKEEE